MLCFVVITSTALTRYSEHQLTVAPHFHTFNYTFAAKTLITYLNLFCFVLFFLSLSLRILINAILSHGKIHKMVSYTPHVVFTVFYLHTDSKSKNYCSTNSLNLCTFFRLCILVQDEVVPVTMLCWMCALYWVSAWVVLTLALKTIQERMYRVIKIKQMFLASVFYR